MIAARFRPARRAGITLTEILIAILIMGVGLISLATLFPLGLLRLREATRLGRSAVEAQVASSDNDARALFYKQSFQNTWYGVRDPFKQDIDGSGNFNYPQDTFGRGVLASGNIFLPANNLSAGNANDPASVSAAYTDGLAVNNLSTGLPICYDPLWRSLTGVMPIPAAFPAGVTPATGQYLFDPTLTIPTGYTFNEARFGSAFYGGTTTPYIPSDADGGVASAYGLQRLTNFIPWAAATTASPASNSGNLNSQYNFTCTNLFLTGTQPADVAGNVFTNIDDIVFNPIATRGGAPSSLVPDMTSGGPQADYRFSWFFTGQQTDPGGNGTQFTGNIVVCENRPFSFDPLVTAGATGGNAPAGETVVEAIYGYGGNSKAVLLRWKSTLPDPPIRVGGWFADTTYERSVQTYRNRLGSDYAAARRLGVNPDTFSRPYAGCAWYRIARRTDPGPDPFVDQGGAQYRSVVVTLTGSVQYTTPVPDRTAPGSPNHVNVACIMPSVVNVFPRAFEVH